MSTLKQASTKKEKQGRILKISELKRWLHTLNFQELLDAMKFEFKSYPGSSSCHEYDLLLEMLSNQSPPPTPIHPRALGFKRQASIKPITNGRWDEEERILRNRFERPRLFQFIERPSPSTNSSSSSSNITADGGMDDLFNGFDVGSLGLPNEIAKLINAEKKASKAKGSKNIKKKSKKSKQHRYFDVLAKKSVQPWGDVYSLGCTERQRVADASIMIGTRIHYGCAMKTSTTTTDAECYQCHTEFEPTIDFRVGKIFFKKNFENTAEILSMLWVASRGRFLSLPLDQKCYDNLDRVPFFAPWFEPTEEWFSLPMYLTSRFEIALWHSFQLSMSSKSINETIPQTIIEGHHNTMTRELFHHSIVKSIYRTLKEYLLEEVSSINTNMSDLILRHLLQHPMTSSNGSNIDLSALISVQLINLGTPEDKFRLKLASNLEEVMSEEIGKRLLTAYPKGCKTPHKGKSTKRTTRKKKKNRRRQGHVASSHPHQLKAIDEDQDEGTKISDSEDEIPPLEQSNYVVNVPNETLNNNKMFVLEIVDNILVETFKRVGFDSYDTDDKVNFSTKVKCHDFDETPQRRDGETYVLKKELKRTLIKDHDKKNSDINMNASDFILEENQMTMKRSNLTWNKAVTQPVFSKQQFVNDFFRPLNLEETQHAQSLLGQQQPNSSKISTISSGMFEYHHHIHNNIEDHNNSTQNNYCLDSAFDRIERNIINDLLDAEHRYEEHFASSTAASIASSILDSENEQVSNDDLSNEIDDDDDKTHIEDFAQTQDNEVNTMKEPIEDKLKTIVDKDPEPISIKKSLSLETPLSEELGEEQDLSIASNERYMLDSHAPQEPKTPPPQLSPILVDLAELGEFRKRTQKENCEKIDSGYGSLAPAPFSSMPSSPRFQKRSWSREDLRIPMVKDDSHDFRVGPSSTSYKNAALKGFKKSPSLSSHDIDEVERKVSLKRNSGSIQFARSVSSLKSFGKEVIIDASIQLNMCAQSESALDDHEDSSHWNVIPTAGLDETDNATLTKDGATTISSFPSIQETEEVMCLREERNAYRDMCLTLGSEIAKLKNLLAAEHSNNSIIQIPSNSKSLEFVPGPESSYDPEHMPPFYQNRYKGLSDSRFIARSDAGIHNETLMSEDRTEIVHGSVIGTDASGKHRTVNSSSIGNIRLSSMSEGRAGSDVASTDYDTGRSVFNPPTSTCFFRRDSVGPVHLHGLQSRLGREISNLLSTVSLQLEKRCSTRELARKRLTTLVTTLWPRAQVKIYGSHVTGLCLPSSDLDFVICLPAVHKNTPADTPGDLEGRNAINETNQKLLARKLKSESWIEPRSIKLIERTVVPVIKVATKDIRSKSLQLDISFHSQDHHGLDAIDMVNDTISHYPMVRPLVLVLKQFLLDKGLLTAYTGGLSSYCLFLMVTKYLQEHPLGWSDSGVYLMGFLDFYGNHFDPRATGISVRKEQYFARPHYPQDSATNWKTAREEDSGLNAVVKEDGAHRNTRSSILNPSRPFSFDPLFVEDPISVGNNVGRNSFRINQVQRAFSDAHRTLVASLEWDMNSPAEDLGRSHLLKCLVQGLDL